MEKTHLTSYSEVIDSVPVLHLTGEVDIYTAPLFKEAITDLISQGYLNVVIDMKHVAFMDSSGFGALLSASKPLRPLNGSLMLAACNDAITRMLDITRLNVIVPVFKTVEQAIEKAKAGQNEAVPT